MYEYYFTFRSMTQAQQAVLELARFGAAGVLLRSPRAISSMGCGYAVRVSREAAPRTAEILRAMGISFEKIIRMGPDGLPKEVWL